VHETVPRIAINNAEQQAMAQTLRPASAGVSAQKPDRGAENELDAAS
jgi:hypothetical protein